MRVQALERINEEMKTIDSSMTIEKIRKKIHTLRNQFRGEIKKMNDVMKSGAGAEDSFTSRLWCFQLLSFLKDGDEKRPSVSSLDELKCSVSGFHNLLLTVNILIKKIKFMKMIFIFAWMSNLKEKGYRYTIYWSCSFDFWKKRVHTYLHILRQSW